MSRPVGRQGLRSEKAGIRVAGAWLVLVLEGARSLARTEGHGVQHGRAGLV